mmetsp:Transcript_9178/g.10182  ORF Transcript_9178/g.10182 Transcript_9178/m.10182 type:complete len:108 (-) Transcript_9178:132-455(-)
MLQNSLSRVAMRAAQNRLAAATVPRTFGLPNATGMPAFRQYSMNNIGARSTVVTDDAARLELIKANRKNLDELQQKLCGSIAVSICAFHLVMNYIGKHSSGFLEGGH